jgi:formate--tetrahydrofolate ligase
MIASIWTGVMEPRPIREVASDLGIDRRHLVPYGDDKAKIRLAALSSGRRPGRLILVSALTPAGWGEGRTTTSIGLAQGLAQLGQSVCLVLHEPSLAVTAARLQAAGAPMVPLEDALMPNLVQTCEGVPAFVYGGLSASLSYGCTSVIATKMALAYADWVVTEADPGFDAGAEMLFDVEHASAGLDTAAVVLVVTVRALKRHAGVATEALQAPDPVAVERGLGGLRKHVEIVRLFGEPPVVVLNRFAADTREEIEVIRRTCEAAGVPFAVSDVFENGGLGGMDMAETVLEQATGLPVTPQASHMDVVDGRVVGLLGGG